MSALLSLVPGPTQAFQQFFIVHMLECWECPGDDALPYSLLPRGYCSYCIAFFLSPPSSFPILTHHIDDDSSCCDVCDYQYYSGVILRKVKGRQLFHAGTMTDCLSRDDFTYVVSQVDERV